MQQVLLTGDLSADTIRTDAQRQEAERAFRNIAEAYATLSGRTTPPSCSAGAPLPFST